MDIYEFLKTSKAFLDFNRDVKSGRCAHAYILYGKDKFAVNKLLKLFACELFCNQENKPCLKCNVCKRLIKGIHPDCQIRPTEEKVLVKDIDFITENASYKPCENDKKIFILENGESMNLSSQNKLLKTLEEPTGQVYIFIGTVNIESLLSTVKSRCRIINLELFSQDKIYKFLLQTENENKAKTLSKLCGGMIEKALNMIQNEEYINAYNYVYNLNNKLKTYDDIADCLAFFKDYDNKTEILDLFQLYLRDLLINKSGQSKLVFANIDTNNIKYKTKDIIYLIEKITKSKKKLKVYCNFAPIFETLLNDMVALRN